MRRFCCPLECGSLQVVTATRYTRSSINRFIDRARVGASATRAGALAAAAAAAAGAPARPQPQAHPRRRRRPRTGAWRGSWPWRNPRNGSWPWRNPRNGSWPWENPRNDFLAILHSKDQHLLNNMNMNLYCKEEKHLERDHGFSTACLSMTSHYVPVTVD